MRGPAWLGEVPVTRYSLLLGVSVYSLISCPDWDLHYEGRNKGCPINCIHINSLSPETPEPRLSGVLTQISPKALKRDSHLRQILGSLVQKGQSSPVLWLFQVRDFDGIGWRPAIKVLIAT